jgi:uncharacterized CHY-type Zn-finger protein
LKPAVRGVDVQPNMACKHWHSLLDIIAIKMKCCGEYYACKDCHDELADHAITVWQRDEWNTRAILCGACGTELTINEYRNSGNECPSCGAGFNPGCHEHHKFYFEMK